MLNEITYFPILGKPLIMWGGIFTLVLMLATASIPILNNKNIVKIDFKWHKRLAIITILSALTHGILGILAFF